MDIKKILKIALYPHIAIMLLLLPVSVILLVHSMVFVGTESAVAIISYVISAYTLTVWCFRIPDIIRLIKKIKNENKLIRRWLSDTHLRINASLYIGLLTGTVFALLQLGLGLYHSSFWYYSLSGYYISLVVMRLYLLRYTKKHAAGELMLTELTIYRSVGVIFLIMNLALTAIIFFMIYFGRTFIHHEITTITIAAYTFTSLTLAIINVVKYRKYQSPVYSAAKAISLASAGVSLITLEATMLTTFATAELTPTARQLFLGLSGGAVSAFIVAMAIYMIVNGTRKIKDYKYAATEEQ